MCRFNLDARGTAVVTKYDDDTRTPVTRPLHPAHYRIQGLPATYSELIDVIENGGAWRLDRYRGPQDAPDNAGVPEVAAGGEPAGGSAVLVVNKGRDVA